MKAVLAWLLAIGTLVQALHLWSEQGPVPQVGHQLLMAVAFGLAGHVADRMTR